MPRPKRSPKKELDDLLRKYDGSRPGAGPNLAQRELRAFPGEPPKVRRAGEPKEGEK